LGKVADKHIKKFRHPIAIGAAFKEIGVKKKRIIWGVLKFNWYHNHFDFSFMELIAYEKA